MKEEIWSYEKGFYKAYTEDRRLINKLTFWRNCKMSCRYHFPGGFGADFIIPSKLYNRVAKLLRLPARNKHPNRVLAGKTSETVKSKNTPDFTQDGIADLSLAERI